MAGCRTASGQAILSNDPHLATSIPSIFAQVGLHCRTVTATCPFDVSGFSLASVPGVVIGKNATIAWGLTTSYLDVAGSLPGGGAGRHRTGRRQLRAAAGDRPRRSACAARTQPRTIRIRSSRHGPLLSDVDPSLQRVAGPPTEAGRADVRGRAELDRRCTPGRTMDALLGLDRAQDFEQFRAAAALLSAPSQNLMYADTGGNIGYQLAGTMPAARQG